MPFPALLFLVYYSTSVLVTSNRILIGPCSLIYAFGNLEYAQGNFTTAKELYEKGRTMSHEHGPTHNLTATFDYKLGVVDAQLENYDDAM